MSVCLVSLIHHPTAYLRHLCVDGTSAWDHTIACARELRALGNITDAVAVVLGGDEINEIKGCENDVFSRVIKTKNTVRSLVQCLHDIAAETPDGQTNVARHLCVMHADAMISYAPLYKKMIHNHTRYAAHHTRGEGYPEGVCPELFSALCCAMMNHKMTKGRQGTSQHTAESTGDIERLAESNVGASSLFSVMEQNINDYDIEVVLAPQDMRFLRMAFRADSRTNFVTGKKVWDAGVRDPDMLLHVYAEQPSLFRGLPRYVYAQLVDGTQPTVYDAAHVHAQQKHAVSGRLMQPGVWQHLIERVAAYAEDAYLAVGFGGEPALHPNIFEYLTQASQSFKRVYVETNGYEWNTASSWWNDIPNNITWIVYMDAYSEGVYKTIRAPETIRAEEAFARAGEFIAMLLKKCSVPDKNVCVQATRIAENEGELDAFCKFWKRKGAAPIIAKYNNVCGTLPDKKIVDLSPVRRFACRHAERDMFIDCDGDMRICFQDVRKEYVLGNITTMKPEELWKRNEPLFVDHVNKKYKELCRSCDEYYTCNA